MTSKTDEDKLRALVPHWIEHNAEHAAEFRNWAERAREAGQGQVAEEIDTAARDLGSANHALTAALEILSQGA